mmetsp:Transcript_12338/g.26019  ORF Transcript_12338/g.26019 Transcript_12338/m.26019 type:complete len:304 (+) Transcript_12338:344-1255(+)
MGDVAQILLAPTSVPAPVSLKRGAKPGVGGGAAAAADITSNRSKTCIPSPVSKTVTTAAATNNRSKSSLPSPVSKPKSHSISKTLRKEGKTTQNTKTNRSAKTGAYNKDIDSGTGNDNGKNRFAKLGKGPTGEEENKKSESAPVPIRVRVRNDCENHNVLPSPCAEYDYFPSKNDDETAAEYKDKAVTNQPIEKMTETAVLGGGLVTTATKNPAVDIDGNTDYANQQKSGKNNLIGNIYNQHSNESEKENGTTNNNNENQHNNFYSSGSDSDEVEILDVIKPYRGNPNFIRTEIVAKNELFDF